MSLCPSVGSLRTSVSSVQVHCPCPATLPLQAVTNGGDGSAKGRPPALKAWGDGSGAENRSRARYRDGALVSNKGEKYVIEKVREEWDGGSRGKVYTKGGRALLLVWGLGVVRDCLCAVCMPCCRLVLKRQYVGP